MFVICSLLLIFNGGGINWQNRADVEGKILKDDPKETKYLVDFSEGLKRFNTLAENPEDFKKKIVEKSDCIKE